MNAIIVTGGKQYKVSEGDVVYIEKLDQEAGATVKSLPAASSTRSPRATWSTSRSWTRKPARP